MKFNEEKILALGFTKDSEEPVSALGKRVWYISPDRKIGIEYRLIYDDNTIDQIFIASQPGDKYFEIDEQYFEVFEEKMADVLRDFAPAFSLN